jgi:tetratricopeptide (TPR) repeat protein
MTGSPRALVLAAALLVAAARASAQTAEAQKAYKAGDYEQSVSLCLSAIQANPSDIDAYAILGWSYLKQGNWDGAYTYGAKASAVQRYDHRITEIRGRAAYGLGRNEEALKLFQDLVTLTPEDTGSGPIYSLMGEIYIRLGQYAHADIALTSAVNHLPTDALLWSRLGYAREAAADYRYAREAYAAALKLNPSLKDAQLGLARVDAKLGR